MIVTVDRHGNTSAASIPLALDVAVRDGRITRGHHVLLIGVGGGFTWGAVFLTLVMLTIDTMKLAFVFPGQGSQSVGMLDGFDDASRGARRRSTKRRRARARTCGRWSTRARPRQLNLTVNTQPVMLTAGVAVLARLARGGRRRSRRWSPATASANTRRWSPPARSLRATRCRWCAFARRRCRRRCRPASARWRRSSASTTTRCAPAARRPRRAQVVEAGELQRAGPDRDRRPQGGGRARDRRSRRQTGAKRALLLPVSAPFHSSLMKPAAERLRERLAQRRDCARRRFR